MDHDEKCERHLVVWLREVDPRRVDRDTLERFRDDRLRESASRRLVVQDLMILSMAWRWGQECNHAPTRLLPRVQVQVDDSAFVINHRTPTIGEVAEVLSRLEGDAGLDVRLLAVTGARVSEVCDLAPDALDMRAGTLYLDGETGQRTFPLPAHLVAALPGRARGDRTRLLDLPPKPASQVVRDRLRRMVVDRTARGGVDVAIAASLTGHSVEVMLRYFLQVSREDRRRAVVAAGLGHFPSGGEVIGRPWGAASATGRGS